LVHGCDDIVHPPYALSGTESKILYQQRQVDTKPLRSLYLTSRPRMAQAVFR
jgi:hypothetical protein